ncbi:MAG TPA: DUF4870 domain-containing protein [Clostridiales bacterium]|nr:DUF4870 domain-containing protein [Clostridiales bacterium]
MQEQKFDPHKSSLGGMDANTMALLCYLATAIISFIPVVKNVSWLAPLLIFFLEKESFFVRFHAMQAFALNLIGSIVGLIMLFVLTAMAVTATVNPLGVLAGAGIVGFIGLAISIIILVFSIMAMVNANKYILYKIPVVGKLSDKLIAMFSSKK